MKKQVKDLAEILGIFAVVCSLVFVGMQLQLDRKVAIAEQYASRAESVKEDYRAALVSQDYFRFIEEYWAEFDERPGGSGDLKMHELVREGTLSIRGVEAEILVLHLSIIGYDNLLFQYQQGLLEEENWIGLRDSLKSSMASDQDVRTIYLRGARSTVRPLVEELLREIEAEEASLSQ